MSGEASFARSLTDRGGNGTITGSPIDWERLSAAIILDRDINRHLPKPGLSEPRIGMSVAGYTGYRSAVGLARRAVAKITAGVDVIESELLDLVDRGLDSMATGLEGLLDDL